MKQTNIKNRDILILLKIVVKELKSEKNVIYGDSLHIYGLCLFIYNLLFSDIISFSEQMLLREFIIENKPTSSNKFYSLVTKHPLFYWNPADKEIRIKWLEYHIRKLTKLKKSKNI